MGGANGSSRAAAYVRQEIEGAPKGREHVQSNVRVTCATSDRARALGEALDWPLPRVVTVAINALAMIVEEDASTQPATPPLPEAKPKAPENPVADAPLSLEVERMKGLAA